MTLMLLAHSAEPEKGVPAQDYVTHIDGVISRAGKAAESAAHFAVFDGGILREVVRRGSEYHDLGKLDNENQAVLLGLVKAKKLPVQHTDAGTAFLLKNEGTPIDAVLVRSHHIGFPDWPDEKNRGELFFRDKDETIRKKVDASLAQLTELHKETIKLPNTPVIDNELTGNPSLFLRIALSCLVDGDHTDTSFHYGEYPVNECLPEIRATERLKALNSYVAELKGSDDRSRLRTEMYRVCRDSVVDASISSCDSPVGTGKTTAVMAHLLAQAGIRQLRRIIVVLPFTNIINQSVDVYRKALVLQGENPEEVVAALHHRADFQDIRSRHLTALWKAPIIVTTAVAFFETLASNTPATLRRLHNLPGCAVFIDESHAALPAKLLPLAWRWMKIFAQEWRCYWVLASGSLNRFWRIPEFDQTPPIVSEIVPDCLREQLSNYETNRVQYRYRSEKLNAVALVDFVAGLPGPRIVILNTVQSAAVAARAFNAKFGRESVEHLSTALTPNDRERILKRVKQRLDDQTDTNWALFATSCVEAGVNISFRTGVRELGSLVSLLQTAGRVNRHGEFDNAQVWTIQLVVDGLFKEHPGLKDAAQVLKQICESCVEISPTLCTDALKREIRLAGTMLETLCSYEEQMRFPQVEQSFRVIATDTRIVLVNEELVKRLEQHELVDWREIQNNSVQVWGYRLQSLSIPEVVGRPDLFKWNLGYDDFLGYMAGILKVESFIKFINGAGII